MYELHELARGIRHPRLAAEELHRLAAIGNCRINHIRTGKAYNPAGVDIFEEEWDNLIILDSCRFDYFRDHVHFSGELESRISRGSKTKEFITGNFSGKRLYDVVYVSANGWYLKLHDEIDSEVFRFEHIMDSRKVERDDFSGHSWETKQTTERAVEMNEAHPDKRLIVHYLPPHNPYVDLDGEILLNLTYSSPYGLKHAGRSKAEIESAYEKSVRFILREAEQLLDELSGLTVITADHGELLGERMSPIPLRRYRHPEGNYVESLVTVPWFIHRDGSRKEIVEADTPHDEGPSDSRAVDDHLQALGYRLD